MNCRSCTTAVLLLVATISAFGQSDFQWTFDATAIFNYNISEASAGLEFSGDLGAADPTIALEEGMRYAVTILNPSFHPFDVIAKASSAGNDVVLLSQGDFTGPLEADAEINWIDADGTVIFTVTPELITAMNQGGRDPGYRCSHHRSTMRGDFDLGGAEGEGEGCAATGAEKTPGHHVADGIAVALAGLTLVLQPRLARSGALRYWRAAARGKSPVIL